MTGLAWVVLGLIAGFLASRVFPKTAGNRTLNVTLGVVGALAGGVVFHSAGLPHLTALIVSGSLDTSADGGLYLARSVETAFVLSGSGGAVGGSVAMLAGYRAIFRQA